MNRVAFLLTISGDVWNSGTGETHLLTIKGVFQSLFKNTALTYPERKFSFEMSINEKFNVSTHTTHNPLFLRTRLQAKVWFRRYLKFPGSFKTVSTLKMKF